MTGIFGLKIHGWKELLHDTLEIWTHQKGERHISETDWAIDKVTAIFFDLFFVSKRCEWSIWKIEEGDLLKVCREFKVGSE